MPGAIRIVDQLAEMADVVLSSLADGEVLRWDAGSGRWVNSADLASAAIDTLAEFNAIVADFDFTTFAEDTMGFVPGPDAAEIAANKVLRADGTWATPASGAWVADGQTQITPSTPIVLDEATGNEVAVAINYTTNKATSGNDTGLLINQTDTASPGTSKLVDLQVGGTSFAWFQNTGHWRFPANVGGLRFERTSVPNEFASITHNGADFTIDAGSWSGTDITLQGQGSLKVNFPSMQFLTTNPSIGASLSSGSNFHVYANNSLLLDARNAGASAPNGSIIFQITGSQVGEINKDGNMTLSAGTLSISGAGAAEIPFSVTGASGQSENLVNVTSFGGTAGDIFKITKDGATVFTSSSSGTAHDFVSSVGQSIARFSKGSSEQINFNVDSSGYVWCGISASNAARNSGVQITNGADGVTWSVYNDSRDTSNSLILGVGALAGSSAYTARAIELQTSGDVIIPNGALTVSGGPIGHKSYTVATLPSAATAAQTIYVSDETGGAVLAFSDGTNWRRSTDRAIVS